VTGYKKLIAIGAALVAAQLLFAACPGDRSPSQSATSLDLISFHGAARQLRETGWINLSSPLSSYYLARGWSHPYACLLYTSPSPRDRTRSRMPSSA